MKITAGQPAPTWSTWRELAAVVTLPKNLKRTLTIALVIGTVFAAMNQLAVILAGDATPITWVKVVVTYLTPLLVSNFGVASATHREQERHGAVLAS